MDADVGMTQRCRGKDPGWATLPSEDREVAATALSEWADSMKSMGAAAGYTGETADALAFLVTLTHEIAEDVRAGEERPRPALTLAQVPQAIALANATGAMVEHMMAHPKPGALGAFVVLFEIGTTWGKGAEAIRAASGWDPSQACQEACRRDNELAKSWGDELARRELSGRHG